jgi:hypothetical protein
MSAEEEKAQAIQDYEPAEFDPSGDAGSDIDIDIDPNELW